MQPSREEIESEGPASECTAKVISFKILNFDVQVPQLGGSTKTQTSKYEGKDSILQCRTRSFENIQANRAVYEVHSMRS